MNRGRKAVGKQSEPRASTRAGRGGGRWSRWLVWPQVSLASRPLAISVNCDEGRFLVPSLAAEGGSTNRSAVSGELGLRMHREALAIADPRSHGEVANRTGNKPPAHACDAKPFHLRSSRRRTRPGLSRADVEPWTGE